MDMKTKTADAVELSVPEHIEKMASAIRKQFKIGEGGVIEAPKEVFEQCLPEGLSMDIIKRYQAHQTDFVSAAALALGRTGLDYFKKPKSGDLLSVELRAGKDKVGLTMHRQSEVRAGIPTEGGQVKTMTKWGGISARWTVSATGNKGSYENVRKHISSQAAAALGS